MNFDRIDTVGTWVPHGRAWALANEVFADQLQRNLNALAGWRQVYATAGGHEGWQVRGDWIQTQRPTFGPAVSARWQAASQISDAAAAGARIERADISQRVRGLLGTDGVAVLPSAASLTPLRDADPGQVDAVRLRAMAITCIAGLAGLPQVSLPMAKPDGEPLGISPLGPPGSDRALIRPAARLHAALA